MTVLQAGHHGSSTSSFDGLLNQVKPQYVVISSGAPMESTNTTYCHPSRSAVERLSAATGGTATKRLSVFKDDELKCKDSSGMADWVELPVSDRVYSTERDGDVTLTTYGDGDFEVSTEATR